MNSMSNKMFSAQRSWSLRHLLLVVILDSCLWKGFRSTNFVQTEITERVITPDDLRQVYLKNNTPVSLRNDSFAMNVHDSSPLSNIEAQRDVTKIIQSGSRESLEVRQFTTPHSTYSHEYDGSSEISEPNKSETVYELTEGQCMTQKIIIFSGWAGIIHGVLNWPAETPFGCTIRIVVPEDNYVEATFDFIKQTNNLYITASEDPEFVDPMTTFNILTSDRYFPLFISGSNKIFFQIPVSRNVTEFKLRFTTNEEDLRMTLPLVNTSPTSGYVTTWGFDDNRRHPCFMNASRTVHVPLNHVAMVSFSYVDIYYRSLKLCTKVYIQLYEIVSDGSFSLKMEICVNSVTPALVLNRSFQIRFYAVFCFRRGFKMIFSFHPAHEIPASTDRGMWDCSVPHYHTFKQHLECNLEWECQGGEDEGPHCPFSSPACNGSVAVANKCYVFLKYVTGGTTWSSVSRECRTRGGNLANVKTRHEQDAFNKIYQFGKSPLNKHVGLTTYDGTLPSQYKKLLVWSDGTVAYDYTYLTSSMQTQLNTDIVFCYVSLIDYTEFFRDSCSSLYHGISQLCEFYITTLVPQMSVLVPLINSEHVTKINNSLYLLCPDGHFTFDFLSCDKASRCGTRFFSLHCQTWKRSRSVLTAMFACLDGSSTLPYTLVCDFRPDCFDGSDENFCRRNDQCDGFKCRNGQCIGSSKRCDVIRDCWDASDEDCNMFQYWSMLSNSFVDPPAVIDFGPNDDVVFRAISPSDPCPDTHFRCPPDGYCLPIYLRCNGVYDCPYHEDEEECASYTCPGFYRCRASTVCVHADHMCDGRPQCPQHDDELFCDLSCPQGCLCQGLAFVCSAIFDAQKFPAMRYLDASSSGMATKDLSPSIYLVWLSLAACDLQVLFNLSLPSLQTLDLSHNLISKIDMAYFMQFENLRVLRLVGNPLQSMFISYPAGHSLLTHLDVSQTLLRAFECDVLLSFPDLQVLNISVALLRNLSSNCFIYSRKLIELDVSGNDVKEIHSETLKNLTALRAVYVSYYVLCCKEFLPDVENLLCFSIPNSFSSCQNLLRSKSLFVVLWILFVASFVGNICCICYTIFLEKENVGHAFGSLMINLNVSDLAMGFYLLVIGTADHVYGDRYLWHEQSWTGGYVCLMTGLLYLVSTEVSVLTLFLMTMERVFVIRFRVCIFQDCLLPFVCCCTWVVGLVLSVLPLFLFVYPWEFYRQNSICAPLSVYKDGFTGWPYLFGIIIVLNLVLIVTADLFHAGSVCKPPICLTSHVGQTHTLDKSLARRLNLLLVTKTLSCSLLTAIGISTHMGNSYPLDIISSVAFLVGPLNVSLSPVLYAISVLHEMRGKSRRLHLLKVLEARSRILRKNKSFVKDSNS